MCLSGFFASTYNFGVWCRKWRFDYALVYRLNVYLFEICCRHLASSHFEASIHIFYKERHVYVHASFFCISSVFPIIGNKNREKIIQQILIKKKAVIIWKPWNYKLDCVQFWTLMKSWKAAFIHNQLSLGTCTENEMKFFDDFFRQKRTSFQLGAALMKMKATKANQYWGFEKKLNTHTTQQTFEFPWKAPFEILILSAFMWLYWAKKRESKWP